VSKVGGDSAGHAAMFRRDCRRFLALYLRKSLERGTDADWSVEEGGR